MSAFLGLLAVLESLFCWSVHQPQVGYPFHWDETWRHHKAQEAEHKHNWTRLLWGKQKRLWGLASFTQTFEEKCILLKSIILLSAEVYWDVLNLRWLSTACFNFNLATHPRSRNHPTKGKRSDSVPETREEVVLWGKYKREQNGKWQTAKENRKRDDTCKICRRWNGADVISGGLVFC